MKTAEISQVKKISLNIDRVHLSIHHAARESFTSIRNEIELLKWVCGWCTKEICGR